MNVVEGFFREVARHSYEVDRQEENMFTSIRRYKVSRRATRATALLDGVSNRRIALHVVVERPPTYPKQSCNVFYRATNGCGTLDR